jgi:hypothetical protein
MTDFAIIWLGICILIAGMNISSAIRARGEA